MGDVGGDCSSRAPHPRSEPSLPQKGRALAEFWCARHDNLGGLYYSDLRGFSAEELAEQQAELERLHAACKGRESAKRNRRRTLLRQIERVREAVARTKGGAGAGD